MGSKSKYIFSILIILASMLFWFCNYPNNNTQVANYQNSKWKNVYGTAEYVGKEECRKCHPNIYDSFILTGMGKSFSPANLAKSSADFHNHTIYDTFSNLYYKPFYDVNGDIFIKEFRLEGRDTIHSRIEKINYIIGSGHHTNSHLLSYNGFMYQAPLTFYTQQKKWDVPPGFENGFNSRFSRVIGLECMSCHNAYPKFDSNSYNKFLEVPQGIDCERCHGPGSIHIQEKKAGKIVNIASDTDFTIVNPKKLPLSLQIDVCQRCHLQGNTVLKEGKSFFDFRPGMPLKEVMDIYLPTYENDEKDFIMAAHAQRLKRSACFIKSNQELTCVSCHNPHHPVKNLSENFFNNKCISCHTNNKQCSENKDVRNSKQNNCISCHMPKSGAVDIPHVTITDHYIRKKHNSQKISKSVGNFKGLQSLNNPNPDIESKAKAYLYFYEKFEKKRYNLDSASKYLILLKDKKYDYLRVYYFFLLSDYQSIIKITEQNPGLKADPQGYYQIAESYTQNNNLSKAFIFINKALEKQSLNLDFLIKKGNILLLMKNYLEAKEIFNSIIVLNPKLASPYNNIGFIHLINNEFTESENYIKKAISLDPDYQPALLNKVKILIQKGLIPQAKNELNSLIKRFPNNNDAKYLLQLVSK